MFSGFTQTTRTFTPKNPCDAIMFKNPVMYLLELKSTKGTSFSFSDKIIKQHQIDDLTKASTYNGLLPFFIFNFRKYNETYGIHITDFIKFKDSTTKKSINRDDCIKIGILIEQKIKKVKYHYRIDKFVKDSEEKYLHKEE